MPIVPTNQLEEGEDYVFVNRRQPRDRRTATFRRILPNNQLELYNFGPGIYTMNAEPYDAYEPNAPDMPPVDQPRPVVDRTAKRTSGPAGDLGILTPAGQGRRRKTRKSKKNKRKTRKH